MVQWVHLSIFESLDSPSVIPSLFLHVSQRVVHIFVRVFQVAQLGDLLANTGCQKSVVRCVVLHSRPSSNQSSSFAMVRGVAVEMLMFVVILRPCPAQVFIVFVPMLHF